MALRPAMEDLILKVRLLIGDPISATPIFDDQQIQDALDQRRTDVYQEDLCAAPDLTTSGYVYNHYHANRGAWEADVTLQTPNGTTLTPTASDYWVGKWTFANQHPPVLITGRVYDVNNTAADLVDLRIGMIATTAFDWKAGDQSVSYGKIVDNLQALSSRLRGLGGIVSSTMVRSDVW